MVEAGRAAPAAQYPGLDLIRLGAALLVALFHFSFNVYGLRFADWGWVGVHIFFVISGFVIAMSADSKTPGQFLFGRAVRLYPAAWIAATVTAVVVGSTAGQYLRSITLFPVGTWVDGVYWTLAVEIVFYALVYLAMIGGVSRFRLAMALGLWSTAFWVFKAANGFLGHPLDVSWLETPTAQLPLLHYGIFFAIGMLLWQKRFLLMTGFVFVGLVAVFARSQAVCASPLIAPMVWLAATGLVVVSAIKGGNWNARTLGLLTYPLYLVHNEVGKMIARAYDPHVGIPLALISVVAIAWAIMRCEQPIAHWLRQVRQSCHLRRNQSVAP